MRGGANGARVRLAPQKDWEVNEPTELKNALHALEKVHADFNMSLAAGKKVSLADVIVLGGCAAIEKAAQLAGHTLTVPFTPGRTDATQAQTDSTSFAVLEPKADAFRNYVHSRARVSGESFLLERASLLNLTAPEMTVLLGGLRVLGINHGNTQHGVLTSRPGMLTNDFFVNLLDMQTEWRPSSTQKAIYEGRVHGGGAPKWTATAVDLVFGSHSQLRSYAEVYACADSASKFTKDFVAAWCKVMELDRFDLPMRGKRIN